MSGSDPLRGRGGPGVGEEPERVRERGDGPVLLDEPVVVVDEAAVEPARVREDDAEDEERGARPEGTTAHGAGLGTTAGARSSASSAVVTSPVEMAHMHVGSRQRLDR